MKKLIIRCCIIIPVLFFGIGCQAISQALYAAGQMQYYDSQRVYYTQDKVKTYQQRVDEMQQRELIRKLNIYYARSMLQNQIASLPCR